MAREAERDSMVLEQLLPRGIKEERVLEAFRRVERHKFVPKKLAAEAYADHPLPIGEGQTISQPYIVALMTESLNLKGEAKVLEVGTGSGYQTAILAELAAEVYSVERVSTLAKNAERLLEDLGYRNIYIKCADGTLGWPENAPYDGILVTAAAPSAPQSLIEQLAENGRLVIPIGDTYTQTLTVIQKRAGNFATTEVCGCVFVPLIGKEGWGCD